MAAALKFLTDVNVPDSVGRVLEARGHTVTKVREIMAVDSPDPIVAEAAMHNGLILVSWDKDFNHQRFLRDRFKSLSRIGFSCPEPDGAGRLEEVLDIVEFCFERANGTPTFMKIGQDKILVRDKPFE